MMENVQFTLNGKPVSVAADAERKLLWVLRTDLGLTGTKYGCGESLCGACTVLIDNEALPSCQIALGDVRGKEVVTIEGLSVNGTLHPVQAAFLAHDAFQCGYCTPGMIMKAAGLLTKTPHPTHAQILDGMQGNLCRCGAHHRIVAAVESAAQWTEGGRR